MRLSRIIIALMAGLAMLAVPTAVGAAPAVQPQPTAPESPYPPGPAELTVSDPTVVVGEAVVLHGEDFEPGEIVDIYVSINPLASAPLDAPLDARSARRADGSTLALVPVGLLRQPSPTLPGSSPLHLIVVADSDGDFDVTYRPAGVGRYVFTAVGRNSRFTATATVTVLATAPQPSVTATAPGGGGGLPTTGDSLGTTLAAGGGLVGLGGVLLALALFWRRRRSTTPTTD
ncbi:hypothetical protein [Micromonospora echinofusca]|uniref:LPXTG-motif cell wall anchor domain-containing protein n=1 Tax=Micromonospora echinofusca TaxID=47858 RepID=A0ABS3VX22_MICEH|nr:hypothetical protein [Micromonospora echinofusca]MBO4209091.1 hypothetical protein [Micromonospora echinofusca]